MVRRRPACRRRFRIRKHWGPINRRKVEVRPECDALLMQIQVAIDASPALCTVLA